MADKKTTGKGTTPSNAPEAPNSGPTKKRRLLGIREVEHFTSLGKATIYRRLDEIKATGNLDLFPIPVEISKGRIGWHEHEVWAWIESRPRVIDVPPKPDRKGEQPGPAPVP